jgi:hypothetical protein
MISYELAKGDTPDVGKLNNTDLKVMIRWFKWNVYKAMSKNKYGLLLSYCEICTYVVAAVNYWEDNMTGVDVNVDVAAGVDIATATGVHVPTAVVGVTGMLWSLITDTAAEDRPSFAVVTRTTVAAARPPPDVDTRTTDVAQPASTQWKPKFAAAAGIPDDAHTTDVAALPAHDTAFSIHNNGDEDWDFAPIGLMTLGIAAAAAATGQDGHQAVHCGLQVLN